MKLLASPDVLPESMWRRGSRYALSALFIAAGVEHFNNAAGFISIVPKMLPRPDLLVAISGAIELVLAVALFYRRARPIVAVLLILLMFAVWPVNFNMAMHPEQFDVLKPWQLWARVVLQVPMMFWALYAGGVWPGLSRATEQSENR